MSDKSDKFGLEDSAATSDDDEFMNNITNNLIIFPNTEKPIANLVSVEKRFDSCHQASRLRLTKQQKIILKQIMPENLDSLTIKISNG